MQMSRLFSVLLSLSVVTCCSALKLNVSSSLGVEGPGYWEEDPGEDEEGEVEDYHHYERDNFRREEYQNTLGVYCNLFEFLLLRGGKNAFFVDVEYIDDDEVLALYQNVTFFFLASKEFLTLDAIIAKSPHVQEYLLQTCTFETFKHYGSNFDPNGYTSGGSNFDPKPYLLDPDDYVNPFKQYDPEDFVDFKEGPVGPGYWEEDPGEDEEDPGEHETGEAEVDTLAEEFPRVLGLYCNFFEFILLWEAPGVRFFLDEEYSVEDDEVFAFWVYLTHAIDFSEKEIIPLIQNPTRIGLSWFDGILVSPHVHEYLLQRCTFKFLGASFN